MANVFSVLSVVLLVCTLVKNRKELKEKYLKLHYAQIIGVIISFLITLAIATILIYYVGNWLVSFISFTFLRYAAFFVIIAVVLFFCSSALNRVLTKITKGIL
ncbi:hypothetical protein [Oceanobacillus sp. J11TS1]|uniref:hypothetical protein n=1 Tax=Oceanobacillus sp. J11TS1 TaxID=2807191 RepID=UPI001B0C78D1|nr:hypothetical protein [Oceanobacillus sp. J11TS1]GIO25149.1 hypothetical protein J11TS1_37300 [Oceanobacillus sp. J11TS1]